MEAPHNRENKMKCFTTWAMAGSLAGGALAVPPLVHYARPTVVQVSQSVSNKTLAVLSGAIPSVEGTGFARALAGLSLIGFITLRRRST